jgi:hypothetical protein
MKKSDIPNLRLANQKIAFSNFTNPAEAVAWFGAVQAQDYLGALWGIGQRCKQATEKSVEKAIADKTLVRTWPMRGTIHFVASEDARWMLELLTPRVQSRLAGRLRQLEVDEAVIARSRKLFGKALQGGNQMRRDALYRLLEDAGIATADQRGLHILCQLAMEGLICFGARQGKQQTFTLLDDWAPDSRRLQRDEALAELAKRYFTSHGPATLHDFIWWSGLTTRDAKAAIELAKSYLVGEEIDGLSYWLAPAHPMRKINSSAAYLLPPYDEYTVAYIDRTAVLNPNYNRQVNTGNGIFNPIIVYRGQVVGNWKRSIKKDKVEISLTPYETFNEEENQAIAGAADRYAEFLEKTAVVA